MKLSITRRFEFAAAHRLQNHGGRCRFLHGHTYVLEVTLEAIQPEGGGGMILDFADLKVGVRAELANFDHVTLLETGDPLIEAIQGASGDLGGSTIIGVTDKPPTVEYLVERLTERLIRRFEPVPVRVARVRLYETPNCWADCVREGLVEHCGLSRPGEVER